MGLLEQARGELCCGHGTVSHRVGRAVGRNLDVKLCGNLSFRSHLCFDPEIAPAVVSGIGWSATVYGQWGWEEGVSNWNSSRGQVDNGSEESTAQERIGSEGTLGRWKAFALREGGSQLLVATHEWLRVPAGHLWSHTSLFPR